MSTFDRQGFRAAFADAQTPTETFDLYGSIRTDRWHPVAKGIAAVEFYRLVSSINDARRDLGLAPMATATDRCR